MEVKVLVAQLCLSSVVTPWTVACQAPLSMRFSKQEYWSALPCLTLGDLLDAGIELASLMSPALWILHRLKHQQIKPGSPEMQVDSLTVESLGIFILSNKVLQFSSN